jgi:Ubiquitin carboxyl-terminal hydrolase
MNAESVHHAAAVMRHNVLSMGFGEGQISNAEAAGCRNTEEAIAFITDGIRPPARHPDSSSDSTPRGHPHQPANSWSGPPAATGPLAAPRPEGHSANIAAADALAQNHNGGGQHAKPVQASSTNGKKGVLARVMGYGLDKAHSGSSRSSGGQHRELTSAEKEEIDYQRAVEASRRETLANDHQSALHQSRKEASRLYGASSVASPADADTPAERTTGASSTGGGDEARAGANGAGADADLARAIEQSLRDSAPNPTVAWTVAADDDDPRERLRQPLDSSPVGLRNIGNTCYLNSLLQVYYNLASFRRTILAYEPSEEIAAALLERNQRQIAGASSTDAIDVIATSRQPSPPPGASSTAHANGTASDTDQSPSTADLCSVEFVIELQRLFAKMSLGNQTSADPSALVHAMRDANGKPIVIGGQQDASEFNGLFLEIVERSLSVVKQDAPPPIDVPPVESDGLSSASDSKGNEVLPPLTSTAHANAVKKMFTATFRQYLTLLDGSSAATTAPSAAIKPITENTIALVVDATGENDRELYSGLDDYTLTTIDYKPDQQCLPAMKSVWFTHFAPVLTIYLQRVRFNRVTSNAEKVHTRYEFDCEIAIDRYLEEHRELSETARAGVKRIRAETKSKLDMLRRVRMFINGPGTPTLAEDEILSPGADSKALRRPESSSLSQNSSNDDMKVAMERTRRRVMAAARDDSNEDVFFVPGLDSTQVDAVLSVLDQIVQHDQSIVTELEQRLFSLSEMARAAYAEIDRTRYRLHAVLVHDGDPSSGHYWTFIRNAASSSESDRWLKFNDMIVTAVPEAEMMSVAMGGVGCASAYCLIYTRVDKSVPGVSFTRDSDAMDVDVPGGSFSACSRALAEDARKLLPRVRIAELESSNEAFVAEIKLFVAKKEVAERSTKSRLIVEAALTMLQDAKDSLDVDQNVDNASASAIVRPGSTCGARSLVEFSFAAESRVAALIFALSLSWSVYMGDAVDANERDLVVFLGSRWHSLAQFPALGSIKVADTDVATEESFASLVVKDVAILLRSVEAEFTAHDTLPLLPAKEVMRNLIDVMTGAHQFSDLERILTEHRTFYRFSLTAMCLMSRALEAWLNGEWVNALGLFSTVVEQDPNTYAGVDCDATLRSFAGVFVSASKMVRSRRDTEAVRLLPHLLVAAGEYLSSEGASLATCDMTCSVVRVILTLLKARVKREGVEATMKGETPAGENSAAEMACSSFLAKFSGSSKRDETLAANHLVKELTADVCSDAAVIPGETLATQYEQISNRVHLLPVFHVMH